MLAKLESRETAVAQLRPQFQPKSIGIELVRGCNFACAMCPVTSNEKYEANKFQFIDLGFLREVVVEIDKNPSIESVWFFHFGEPMAHPQYEQCLEILYTSQVARKAMVIQHTNASLLRGAKAEAILNIPVITNLTFSFDGWGDQESFERLRGPHFDKVVSNIRAFAKMAATRRQDLSLSTCSIIPKSGELTGVEVPSWDEAVLRLEELFAGTHITVNPRPMHSYSGNDDLAVQGVATTRVKGGCTFVERNDLYVTVNGFVQPCCAVYDEKFNVGSLKQTSLSDLLNNDRMSTIRHNLRLNQRRNIKHCKTCTLSIGGYMDDQALADFWSTKIANGEVTEPGEIEYLKNEFLVPGGEIVSHL